MIKLKDVKFGTEYIYEYTGKTCTIYHIEYYNNKIKDVTIQFVDSKLITMNVLKFISSVSLVRNII